MSALFDQLIARPRSSLFGVIVLIAAIGLGAFRLQIDFSPEQVYVGQDNAVEFCEEHKRMFRFEDSIVLVVLESTDHRSLMREDCLRWMSDFAKNCRQIEGIAEVTSIVTLERPHISITGDDPVSWLPWLAEDYYANEDYLQNRLKRIPLLNDTLVSGDQRLLLTLVDLGPEDRTIRKATVRVRQIEQAIAQSKLPEGTTTFISGVPAIRVDVINSILNDQRQMVPMCSALFLLVSLMMFRSPRVTVLSLLSALASVVLTTGLMGWAGVTFSVMSNVIPALLLIIGAANSVHVLSRFQVEVRQTGADLKACARSTMQEMSKTCFLTLATTAIGFGSLLVARAELLQSLGLQAAMGMVCCYVALMTILPQTLVLCGPVLARQSLRNTAAMAPDNPDRDSTNPDVRQTHSPSRLSTLWRTFGAAIGRYSAAIVAIHLLMAVWTLWSCRNIPINSYMFETYDGDHPTIQAVHKMDEHMSGLISLEVQLRAEDRARFFDGDLAVALSRVRKAVSSDEVVTFYRDYVEFLSVFDHGRTVTDNQQDASASLKRVQIALRRLNSPAVTSAFLAGDQPAARVMMRIRDVGSAGMKQLIDRVHQILERELPPDVQYAITGDAYLHAICMDAFVRDLFYSLVAASGVIFLLITVLFRSLRIGVISAIPNMFPLVMTLGYMNLRGYELTAGNVIVFAISLGIAVDDTIHFLARYRDERKTASPLEAIQGTLFSSGRAIVLTSVLVVSGLSILIYSDFVPTRRFAELTAITMCSALPGDVILLPAMLQLFEQKRRPKMLAGETDEPATNS